MDPPKTDSEEGKSCEIEDEFDWQDYLEATNSEEVPHTVFAHVEQSLQNGFEEGMKLEVPLNEKADCHWIATVVMACGPLLRLRYEGETDLRKVFWCDTTKVEAHPLGWCEANRRQLEPPEHLVSQVNVVEVKQNVKGTISVPPELLSGEGCTPVDRIKSGMKVEVQDQADPYRMWIATIVENVGGRLLLRYDTPENAGSKDFWLFYSSSRIHPVGWANERGPPWVLRKPSNITSNHKQEEWQAVLDQSKEEAAKLPFPRDILNKSRKSLLTHDVTVGDKVEAIHPGNMADICPATVVKIFDSYYFLVAIDVMVGDELVMENHQLTWLATATHPHIFPVGWAAKHNINIRHPRGFPYQDTEEFDWTEYLAATKSQAAPLPPRPELPTDQMITARMKLEAVDHYNPNNVCVATVERITDHLLWIRPETVEYSRVHLQSFSFRAVSCDSLDIFPVGWCNSNSYPLKAPKVTPAITPEKKKSPEKEDQSKDASNRLQPAEKSSSWCPKIFFNHRCFSGPFLSKGRLALLPKHVGPGPVTLVMKEVLSMLISIAYISSRVLKELQCVGPARPGMHLELLKAKYKSNVYRATVEIVTSADKVADFCKEVCRKLQVCPYLFSPQQVGLKTCPENCQTLSKTRFLSTSTASSQSTLVGQRKVGRPPESRKTTNYPWPRRPPSTRRDYLAFKNKSRETSDQGDRVSDDGAPKDKRMRYETRGIKLPNFGLRESQVKQALEGNENRPITPLPLSVLLKKRGRRSRADNERIKKMENLLEESKMDDSQYRVDTNPLLWTVEDVFQYIKRSQDCDMLANLLRDEEFDGRALMLLNLSICLHELCLSQHMAVKLCRHVEAVKFAFFSRFVSDWETED